MYLYLPSCLPTKKSLHVNNSICFLFCFLIKTYRGIEELDCVYCPASDKPNQDFIISINN